MCDLDFADRLNDSGFTLSVEEKAGLQAAMLQRKLEEKFSVFQFWGKIFGKQNDYIICFGLTSSYDHPTKKFYFTNANKIVLQQMPEMSESDTERASRAGGMFEGDPSFPLEGGDAAEGEEAAPLSELHRLAATVAAIDADTATVPRGAWIVSPTHEVVSKRGRATAAASLQAGRVEVDSGRWARGGQERGVHGAELRGGAAALLLLPLPCSAGPGDGGGAAKAGDGAQLRLSRLAGKRRAYGHVVGAAERFAHGCVGAELEVARVLLLSHSGHTVLRRRVLRPRAGEHRPCFLQVSERWRR